MKITLLTALLLISVATPLKAQEVCFMERTDGTRVNLEGICGRSDGTVAQLVSVDQQFASDYRRLAANQSQSALILNMFDKNPALYIDTAKIICRGLRKGESERSLMRAWIREWIGSSPQVERAGMESGAILFSIAPKYYCPEFSNVN